jgi:uncharacterized protein YecT (DUF1311 family)
MFHVVGGAGMIRIVTLFAVAFAGLALESHKVEAASFDCDAASMPFEHAICDNEDLSHEDDRLARTYATAVGGLSEIASEELRADQRAWLAYAQRACTEDAEPLETGRYDEDGVSCLVEVFQGRSTILEASRMIAGLRFYPSSRYEALPDPEAEPSSFWAVARHETTVIQIDGDEGFSHAFNDLVRLEGEAEDGEAEPDASSNSTYSIVVEEVTRSGRITLLADMYWYGHGAAHGNYGSSYLHYLPEKGRFMEASDLFDGKNWQQRLVELTMEALRAEHGDNLMLDGPEYIAEPIADPRRWDLSDDYGLKIQFQPYEVAAYAYGAPTATVRWSDLEDLLSAEADEVRW